LSPFSKSRSQYTEPQTLTPECPPVVSDHINPSDKELEKILGVLGRVGQFTSRILQQFKGKTGFWITRNGKRLFVEKNPITGVGKTVTSALDEVLDAGKVDLSKLITEGSQLQNRKTALTLNKIVTDAVKKQIPNNPWNGLSKLKIKEIEARTATGEVMPGLNGMLTSLDVPAHTNIQFAARRVFKGRVFSRDDFLPNPTAAQNKESFLGIRNSMFLMFEGSSKFLKNPALNFQMWQQYSNTYIRTQYELTQKFFKAKGIENVILYRGMHLTPKFANKYVKGTSVKVELGAVSSFTPIQSHAKGFSALSTRFPDRVPVVIKAKVPRQMILSNGQTGLGDLDLTNETFVLGGTSDFLVEVIEGVVKKAILPEKINDSIDLLELNRNWILTFVRSQLNKKSISVKKQLSSTPECPPVFFGEKYDFEKALGAIGALVSITRFLGRKIQIFRGDRGFWITRSGGGKFFVTQDKIFPVVDSTGTLIAPELIKMQNAGLFTRASNIDISTRKIVRNMKDTDSLFKRFKSKNLDTFPDIKTPVVRGGFQERTAQSVGRGEIKTWLDSWSETSSDTDHFAVTNQLAAAKEFNLAPSASMLLRGISNNLKRNRAQLRSKFKGLIEPGSERSIVQSPQQFVGKLNNLKRRGYQDLYRSGLRSMYTDTQNRLRAEGIKEITVFRGMGWIDDTTPPWVTALKVNGGKVDDMTMNPISSWTLDKDVATAFAKKGTNGVVVTTRIPANQVLSVPSTGYGVPGELEIAVLGRPVPAIIERIK